VFLRVTELLGYTLKLIWVLVRVIYGMWLSESHQNCSGVTHSISGEFWNCSETTICEIETI
jgi:hypothetical protein